MQPKTIFEAHFRAAQTLLKVYRLLDSDSGPLHEHTLVPKLREVIACDADESLLLLLNDLFLGIVCEERAEVPAWFFGKSNLALLLRQAVVSACTAMDVYFPVLLEAHLPTVVAVRQRNFLPNDGEVKDLFKDFRLRLDELPAFLEEESASGRWSILARRILEYCRDRTTLSNVTGISATMLMLGVSQPWRRITERSGLAEQALRMQVQVLTKRRNDIVHRGDRPVGQPDGSPQPIDYAWTSAHVNAAASVVLACDALAAEAIEQLRAAAVAV